MVWRRSTYPQHNSHASSAASELGTACGQSCCLLLDQAALHFAYCSVGDPKMGGVIEGPQPTMFHKPAQTSMLRSSVEDVAAFAAGGSIAQVATAGDLLMWQGVLVLGIGGGREGEAPRGPS
eukprot:scaffold46703_cov33-Tisochrysis_lutea.AAC.2